MNSNACSRSHGLRCRANGVTWFAHTFVRSCPGQVRIKRAMRSQFLTKFGVGLSIDLCQKYGWHFWQPCAGPMKRWSIRRDEGERSFHACCADVWKRVSGWKVLLPCEGQRKSVQGKRVFEHRPGLVCYAHSGQKSFKTTMTSGPRCAASVFNTNYLHGKKDCRAKTNAR